MIKIKISYLILLTVLLSSSSRAQELVFFHEKGCPECARIHDFLEKRISPNYAIQVTKLEIHDSDNAEKLIHLANLYESREIIEKGTPAIFIGDSAFHGSGRNVQRKIEQAIRVAIRTNAASPLSRLKNESQPGQLSMQITLPAVISAAAVDAVNPCACAVLVLLLGTILLASNRKRSAVMGAGFAFTAACYLSYFLMGVGLFSVVQIIGIQHYIYVAVSILALFIGIWNMKDYFWLGRWFSIEVPQSWQPTLKKITSNITSVPGAFGMGIVISLFLLPCTSGPYVVIIGMLSSVATRTQAFLLLLLYNLIFVLPFIFITLGVAFGFTTTARVERWRQKSLPRFHFITGLIMFLLGAGMLVMVSIRVI